MVLFALTRVKAFDDRCRVDEISSAQDAHEVRVELGDLYPGRSMHLVRNEQQPCPGKSNNSNKKKRHVKPYEAGEGASGAQRGHRLEKTDLCSSALKQRRLLC